MRTNAATYSSLLVILVALQARKENVTAKAVKIIVELAKL